VIRVIRTDLGLFEVEAGSAVVHLRREQALQLLGEIGRELLESVPEGMTGGEAVAEILEAVAGARI
jgi:hypothetical protein